MAMVNYKSLLNYCFHRLKTSKDNILVLIFDGKNYKYYALENNNSNIYDALYTCETDENVDGRIFFGVKNLEVILLMEKSNFKKLKIHAEIKSKIKIEQVAKFSTTVSPNFYEFSFNKAYQDTLYRPPPAFEYFIRDVCNFEAMFYNIINTFEVYMGETIAILIPFNARIHVYILRRLRINFLLYCFFDQPVIYEFTAMSLQFPKPIISIIVKPADNSKLKVSGNFIEIKNKSENIKKGFEFYEKAENEKALAIHGNSTYINAVANAGTKHLLETIYLEKVIDFTVIEINEDFYRICVFRKRNKIQECLFSYPDESKQWIPVYISFLREVIIIGKNAIEDFKTQPNSVIFDIFKLIGKTAAIVPESFFQNGIELAPINDSADSSLGFHIKTFKGIMICRVEMALAILFKYVLTKIEKKFNVPRITVRVLHKKLSNTEKKVIKAAGSLLKLEIDVKSF